jgi:hypothetical protein
LLTVGPVTLSLVQLSPPLPPIPVCTVYDTVFTYAVPGVRGSGPQTDKHPPQSPFAACRSNFWDETFLHCLLRVLSFYYVLPLCTRGGIHLFLWSQEATLNNLLPYTGTVLNQIKIKHTGHKNIRTELRNGTERSQEKIKNVLRNGTGRP